MFPSLQRLLQMKMGYYRFKGALPSTDDVALGECGQYARICICFQCEDGRSLSAHIATHLSTKLLKTPTVLDIRLLVDAALAYAPPARSSWALVSLETAGVIEEASTR